MTSNPCTSGYELDSWTVPNDWNIYDDAQLQSSSKCTFRLSPELGQEPHLIVVRQPEEQHRARYLSEGSRGAIKDRSGASHCTIQLVGYYRPTRVEIYAGSCSAVATAHQLYELIPVSGKGSLTTPCKKVVARDGIHCLEVVLRPENDMTAVLDCIGILKICTYDARRKMTKNSGINCAVQLMFRAYVPLEDGTESIIEAKSEPIRCMQQLGVPEVLKLSLTSISARGGKELFIIGRNFDRNATVVFREYKEDGSLLWSAEATVQRQYSHQCHLVCTTPQYHDMRKGGTVSLTVRCGSKLSHPISFHFIPYQELDDWRPPSSPEIYRKKISNISEDQSQEATVLRPNYVDLEETLPATIYQFEDSTSSEKLAIMPKRCRIEMPENFF